MMTSIKLDKLSFSIDEGVIGRIEDQIKGRSSRKSMWLWRVKNNLTAHNQLWIFNTGDKYMDSYVPYFNISCMGESDHKSAV